jgi:glycine cleavage system transcriptional repressor
LECNLSDAQMAVLQGHTSMMLIVEAPESLEAETLQAALVQGAEGLGHAVWVHRLSEAPPTTGPGSQWVVSVHGADRPGVVFEVTRVLAGAGVNIVDLQSRLAGPVGSLTMRVDVPIAVDGTEVADKLDRLGEQLGLSCSMRPLPDRP